MKFFYILLCLSFVISPIMSVNIDTKGQSYNKILKYVDTMKQQVIKEQNEFNKIYNSQLIEHNEQKKQLDQSSFSLTNIKKEVDASLKRLDLLNKEKNNKLNEKSNIKKSLIYQKSVIKEELNNIERMYKEADKVKHYSDYKDIIKEINDLKFAIAKESKDITNKYKLLLSKLKNTITTKANEIGMTLNTQKKLNALYSNENNNHKRIIKSYEIFMNNYKKLIAKNKNIKKSFREELQLLDDVYKFLTSNNCKSKSKAPTIQSKAPTVQSKAPTVQPKAPVVQIKPKAPTVQSKVPNVQIGPKAPVIQIKPKVPNVQIGPKAPTVQIGPIVKTNKVGLTANAIKVANKRDEEFNNWVVSDAGKEAVKFCRSLGIENKKDIFEGCLTDMLMTNDKNIAKEAIVMEDVKNNIKCVGKMCNKIATKSKVCVGSGDPHFINYDGEVFHIQEPGIFTLTRTKDNKFQIQEKMRKNGNVNMYGAVSCMTGVAIKYKNVIVEIDLTDYSHITINSKKQLLPEDFELVIGGIKIKYGKQLFEWKDKGVTTKALKIKIPNNFEVIVAEGYCGTVSIKAPQQELGKVSGICGNADGVRDSNDYRNPAGELVNVNRGKPGWENGNGGPSFPLTKWQLEWKALGNTCLFSKDCEKVPASLPKPKVPISAPKPKVPVSLPKAKVPVFLPKAKVPVFLPKAKVPTSAPKPKVPTSAPKPKVPTSAPKPKVPVFLPKPKVPTSAPKAKVPTSAPKAKVPAFLPKAKVPAFLPKAKVPTSAPKAKAKKN